MIIFDLQCANGHQFEGWFEDSRDCENQQNQSMIACPVCNNATVMRIPSTFAIKQSHPVKDLSDAHVQLDNLQKKVISFIETHFDNVGCNFAREALKMHYGIEEPRSIRGVSTHAEEKMLADEGVDFIKIPMPREPETES